MSSLTPKLGLYKPVAGDGLDNGQVWFDQMNANLDALDAAVPWKASRHAVATTPSLAYYQTANLEVQLTQSCELISTMVDRECWVRVYGSAAARDRDAGRAPDTKAPKGRGLYGQTHPYPPDDLTTQWSKAPFFHNLDTPKSATAYLAVTNLSLGYEGPINLDFEFLPQEQFTPSPPKGDTGLPGRTLLVLSAAPTTLQGQDGDSAFDKVAKVFYGPKSGGAWPAGVSLQGLPGLDGKDGTSFIWRGNWSSTTAYVVNDVASSGGSTYIALLAGTNHDPATSPTYWQLVAQKGADGVPGSGLPADYISGLSLAWVSGSAVTVQVGSAVLQSTGSELSVASPIALTGLSGAANTWLHIYLYNNAGTAAVEVSATAPATAYKGSACSKTGDTSRRYLGSVLLDAAGAVYRFRSLVSGNALSINWVSPSNVAPFLLLSAGAATAITAFSAASLLFGAPAVQVQIAGVMSVVTGGMLVFGFGADMVATTNPELTAEVFASQGNTMGSTQFFFYPPAWVKRDPSSTNLNYITRTVGAAGSTLYLEARGLQIAR